MPIIHVYENCTGEWISWIETGEGSHNVQWAASMVVNKDRNVAIVGALERAGISFTDSESPVNV